MGGRSRGSNFGRRVARVQAVKRGGARSLQQWRPVRRVSTPAGLVQCGVGTRAGVSSPKAGGAVTSSEGFCGGTRSEELCAYEWVGRFCSVEKSLNFGVDKGAFKLVLSPGKEDSWCWGFFNAMGVIVVSESFAWALAWAPFFSLLVDSGWAFGDAAKEPGSWTKGRAAGGSPRVWTTVVEPVGGGSHSDLDSSVDPLLDVCCVAGPGTVLLDAVGAGGIGRGPLAALGDSTTEGAGYQAVRCSPRLALRAASSVLDSAVAWKARLQDCGARRAGARGRMSRRKISELSRKSGVTLCEEVVDSFSEFVSHGL